MSHDRTLHQKMDDVIEITTEIRIKQGVMEERVDRAKEERAEMKEDIKENSKMKRISNLWDGVNSIAFGIYAYFTTKQL